MIKNNSSPEFSSVIRVVTLLSQQYELTEDIIDNFIDALGERNLFSPNKSSWNPIPSIKSSLNYLNLRKLSQIECFEGMDANQVISKLALDAIKNRK